MPPFQPYWGKPTVRNDRGTVETSASSEARYAPLSYPTEGESVGAVMVDLNGHEAGKGVLFEPKREGQSVDSPSSTEITEALRTWSSTLDQV
jgi:hypothetical protein